MKIGDIVRVRDYEKRTWIEPLLLLAKLPKEMYGYVVRNLNKDSGIVGYRICESIPYEELQTKSGIKEGDWVKVVRKCVNGQNGWANNWADKMDLFLGKTFQVKMISIIGISLYSDEFSMGRHYTFPVMSLKKVDAPEDVTDKNSFIGTTIDLNDQSVDKFESPTKKKKKSKKDREIKALNKIIRHSCSMKVCNYCRFLSKNGCEKSSCHFKIKKELI